MTVIGVGTMRVADDPEMEFRLKCPNCTKYVETPMKAHALQQLGNWTYVKFFCKDCGLHFWIEEQNYDWFARNMAFYKKGAQGQ